MPNSSITRLPDAEFIARAVTINERCDNYAVIWGIDATRLARLNTLTTAAKANYEANKDRITHSTLTSIDKKASFGELKNFLSPLIDYLVGNTKVTDEELELMGLRSRAHHKHEPIPAPDEPPVLTVMHQHDELNLYVSREEHGQPTRSIRPANYHGFKLRWRFEDETEFHTQISTRLHVTLYFEREDATKRVVMSAAWVNPRLQEGPWCEDVIEVIS